MNKSPIEWTDYTSNPIQAYADGRRGWYCERVSPGCAHCYSAALNTRIRGNGVDFLPANRDRVTFRLNDSELAEWSRKRRDGRPLYTGRCFAFDMTDLFGEWVPDEWLDKIFAAMALAPNLEFQILTKRPERMRAYLTGKPDGIYQDRATAVWAAGCDMRKSFDPPYQVWPLPNVWLGVTVENQRWADVRIPLLLDTPAAVRFVSAEPLLKPVNLRHMDVEAAGLDMYFIDALTGRNRDMGRPCPDVARLDWIIVGGESGSKHRPFDSVWARAIVRDCAEAGVAVFVKQLGGFRPGNALEDLPPDLRVREFPR